MEEIYLSYESENGLGTLVIEGDPHSVWAFYITPESQSVKFDGFICSRGTIIDDINEVNDYLKNGFSPPISSEYANENTKQNVSIKDISIAWNEEIIEVFIDNELFLIMNTDQNTSLSLGISKDGPYGGPIK